MTGINQRDLEKVKGSSAEETVDSTRQAGIVGPWLFDVLRIQDSAAAPDRQLTESEPGYGSDKLIYR